MVKSILIVVGIFLALGGGALSYLNMEEIKKQKEEIASTDGKISGLNSDLAEANAKLTKNEGLLDEANKAKESAEADLLAAKSEKAALETELTAKKAEVETKTAEVAAALAKADESQKQIAAIPVEELQKQITDAQAAKAQAESEKQEVAGRLVVAEKQVVDLQKLVSSTMNPVSGPTGPTGPTVQPGLTATVQAVNRAWNFVTLDVGGNQGVTSGTEFKIVRGGAMIGKVRVSTVESRTSSADIKDISVEGGVRPGDAVIYLGGNKKKPL